MNVRHPDRPIRVGLSRCLQGEEVRYDGGHKRDRYVTDVLGAYFEFVPVCPELEVGMMVPREAVHLEGEVTAPRMVGNRTGEDWTGRMNRHADARIGELAGEELSGFILKKGSPSCGLFRVPVKNSKGMPDRNGQGLFAAALVRKLPLLPVEEEGRLNDAVLRDNFIVRVFAYRRLQDLFSGRFQRGRVVAFHAREKVLLMAHSPGHLKQLGQLVAGVKNLTPAAFRDRYRELFMTALRLKATTRKNTNVLQHLLGYVKKDLAPQDKRDVLSVIEDYHRELVPLVVPLTLVRHYLRKHGVDYLLDQTYLSPHPRELMLRNRV